jgi:hypothetical protein
MSETFNPASAPLRIDTIWLALNRNFLVFVCWSKFAGKLSFLPVYSLGRLTMRQNSCGGDQ